MDVDTPPPPPPQIQGGQQVLKPVACQFYNYIAHRTATRAGKHDTQQGTVTAAIAGGFAETQEDRNRAKKFIKYCDTALPSHRFQKHIDIDDCPSSCRAELVYSVDVRALRHPTGRFVALYSFLNTLLPLLTPFFIDLSSTISSSLLQTLGRMKIS